MQVAVAPSEPVHTDSAAFVTPTPTRLDVSNSQSVAIQSPSNVHPVPALDGFGLVVIAIVMGAAALWAWRRQ
jgi:hypothetical protein